MPCNDAHDTETRPRRYLRGFSPAALACASAAGHRNPADLFWRPVPAERSARAGGQADRVPGQNLDGKAMEFESTSLRVEKVVGAKSEGVVNVRALKPGRYEFYDDFNDKARGALNVQ